VANQADDIADLLLEHDLQVLRGDQLGRAEVADEAGRPDCRVARERQFAAGRKDPDPRRMNWVSRLEHEHSLGEIEFSGDGLHAFAVEALAIQHHGERVARKPPLGEDVERIETARHAATPTAADRIQRLPALKACSSPGR
jgi:hypothetical protein